MNALLAAGIIGFVIGLAVAAAALLIVALFAAEDVLRNGR